MARLSQTREESDKRKAIEATAEALKAYDAATRDFDSALREFLSSHHNGAAVLNARNEVLRCEREEVRLGLAPIHKASALERSRAAGDVRHVLQGLLDYTEGRQYADLSYEKPLAVRNDELAKAGIL